MKESENKIYFYPIWIRIWHGLNAIGILVLIYTGITMYYSNRGFQLMDFQLAINMHNITGIMVGLSYLIFSIGNLRTTNHKHYKVKRIGMFEKVLKQSQYYMVGMFNNQHPPFPLSEKRKFNPLQKLIYSIIMYVFMPGLIITGIGLLFPELIIENVYHLSGIFLTALLHASLGFLVSIFLIIHLYVASIGKHPLENFKSILNGYHDPNKH
ncbi:MAG: cytochrome b/b6 domain-containing protein [Bacteroidia bacterium]|nr:cytochrome b/b6 domain-containing protein [Bacteroidia bacterium]